MSVFLRWGIFGILAVAGLISAYNASKKLAENRAKERPAAVQSQGAADSDAVAATDESTGAEGAPVDGMSAHCAAELAVARRALQARGTASRSTDCSGFRRSRGRSRRRAASGSRRWPRTGSISKGKCRSPQSSATA